MQKKLVGDDVITYTNARPVVHGVLAFVYHLIQGRMMPGTNEERIKKCFEQANTFLNVFEDINDIK